EKAPIFTSVFPRFNNVDINTNAENEKIFSAELGYGFRGEKLAANINIYRTQWNDRTLTRTFQNPDGTFGSANILGVNALHQGIELDFTYKVPNLTVTGMLSLGDWTWANNLENIQIFDEEQNLVNTVNMYIEGLKVSDAAQTTAALGLDYKLMEKTHFTVDFNYYDNLYARYDPNDRGTPGAPQAWKAPAYTTFDMSLRYGFKIGDLDTTLTGRMNNVFDTQYIADATDGAGSVAQTALVWFGFGRTFNISAKIRF
ncbi:TonB-dependent receptor, partial [hydrothermal vent metagenome]